MGSKECKDVTFGLLVQANVWIERLEGSRCSLLEIWPPGSLRADLGRAGSRSHSGDRDSNILGCRALQLEEACWKGIALTARDVAQSYGAFGIPTASPDLARESGWISVSGWRSSRRNEKHSRKSSCSSFNCLLIATKKIPNSHHHLSIMGDMGSYALPESHKDVGFFHYIPKR